MGYLQEICLQIDNQDFPAFVRLWEEYVKSDIVCGKEMLEILNFIQQSEAREVFGSYVDIALEAWDKVEEKELKDEIFKTLIDLQTTNSDKLFQEVTQFLESRYKDHKFFKEKMRLVGLRHGGEFQGAVRNFELLNHMDKGKFVFHHGGWGVGEIMDISLIREQLAIEFENVIGIKDMSFQNAFTYLTPLPDDHFLSRRFGSPDILEAESRKDPVKVLRIMLKDLGPKTAQEIKDEFYELVIPAKSWQKWWQSARAKAKKDTMIETPSSIQGKFYLREKELTHEDRFRTFLAEVDDESVEAIIDKVHEFSRMFPEVLKNDDIKALLREKLLKVVSLEQKSEAQLAQVYIFLEDFYKDHLDNALIKLIQKCDNIEKLIEKIGVVGFKKRILNFVRKHREDWCSIFTHLLIGLPHHFLRDYLLKELNHPDTKQALQNTIRKLIDHPVLYPEAYIWYFQKALVDKTLPYSDKEGVWTLFETLFILLYHLESVDEYRDLVKKIHNLITKGRYQLVRDMLKGSSIEYAQELLLLATKCQTFNRHDIKILISLARVVHPSLEDKEADEEKEKAIEDILWTTQEGYNRIQEKIKHIATVETVDNAKEIEAARALGDLRENSEYKFAQERRARLQAELKLLSDQIKHARVLTPEDVSTEEVGVGSKVELKGPEGKVENYLILGPWDADPDKSILSFQSQLARSMRGKKVGDVFDFRGEKFEVASIKSYFG